VQHLSQAHTSCVILAGASESAEITVICDYCSSSEEREEPFCGWCGEKRGFFCMRRRICAKILTSAQRSLHPRAEVRKVRVHLRGRRARRDVCQCAVLQQQQQGPGRRLKKRETPCVRCPSPSCGRRSSYSLLSPCFASFSQVDEPSFVHASRRLNSLSANHFALLSQQHAKCMARRNEEEGEILSLCWPCLFFYISLRRAIHSSHRSTA